MEEWLTEATEITARVNAPSSSRFAGLGLDEAVAYEAGAAKTDQLEATMADLAKDVRALSETLKSITAATAEGERNRRD